MIQFVATKFASGYEMRQNDWQLVKWFIKSVYITSIEVIKRKAKNDQHWSDQKSMVKIEANQAKRKGILSIDNCINNCSSSLIR